jgi:hypothetical protein
VEVSGLHLSMACDVSWTCYESFHDLSDFGVFVLLEIRKEQGDSVKRRYKSILSHFQVAARTQAWTTKCVRRHDGGLGSNQQRLATCSPAYMNITNLMERKLSVFKQLLPAKMLRQLAVNCPFAVSHLH